MNLTIGTATADSRPEPTAHDIDWNCFSKPKPISHKFDDWNCYSMPRSIAHDIDWNCHSKPKLIAHDFGDWNCYSKPKAIFHDIDWKCYSKPKPITHEFDNWTLVQTAISLVQTPSTKDGNPVTCFVQTPSAKDGNPATTCFVKAHGATIPSILFGPDNIDWKCVPRDFGPNIIRS